MDRIARVVLPLLMLATALAAAPGARAAHIDSFHAAGECTEYATGILVDAGRAQAAVPEGFVVLDLGGKALVAVFAEECVTSVNGAEATPSILSGVFVFVDPAQSPAGCEGYDFAWGDSVDSDWHRAMTDLGWRNELLPGTEFSRGPAGFTMRVPSEIAPWSARAVAGAASLPAPVAFTSIHCHVGPRGLVRGTYDHEFLELGAGAGRLEIGAGSLWGALGAKPQAAFPGLVARFTWTGITEIVAG